MKVKLIAIGRLGACGMIGTLFWSVSMPWAPKIEPVHWKMPAPVFSFLGVEVRAWTLANKPAKAAPC